MTAPAEKPIAVESTGVQKTYQSAATPAVVALETLDLKIPAGQIVGLLGPHRSGKTTLLKMLAGKLKPSSGSICIQGHDLRRQRQEALRRVGLVLEETATPASMAVWDYLLAGSAKQTEQLERSARLLHDLGLWQMRYEPLAHCSPSLRYALALARACVAAPPIVLVDLPVLANDQPETAVVTAWIAELAQEQGCTVVLATRQPGLVAQLCTRVLVMSSGRIMADIAQPCDTAYPQPAGYSIRVKGHLPAHWSAWFNNLTVNQEPNGSTLLCGRILDQADLHGLLLKIRDLGLPVLSVMPLPVTVGEG